MSIFEADPKLPRAREDGLLAERVDGDLVVYDELTMAAHCLSAEAASVWERCDGETSQAALVRELRLSSDTVERAVQELRDAGLTVDTGITRRDAAKRGVALGAIAMTASGGTLLTTMAVPAAAAACSQPNNGCCTGLAPASGCWPEADMELMALYGLFAMTGATIKVNAAQAQGNVGVASGATISGANLTVSATTDVPSPKIFVDPGPPAGSFTATHSGGTIVSVSQAAVESAALDASSKATSIASCAGAVNAGTFGNLSTAQAVNVSAATPTVFYITTGDLTANGGIALTGNSNSFVIINVNGDINLTGGGITSSGIPTSNILTNQAGTGVNLQANVPVHMAGTLISPHGGTGAAYEPIAGNTFLGGNVVLMSNAIYTESGCPCRCP